MTDWREELIKKMERAIVDALYGECEIDEVLELYPEAYFNGARAALAVAEPVIREQCARIAEKSFGFHGHYAILIAAAIREGGKDD